MSNTETARNDFDLGKPAISLALLLAGALLVGFSWGRWLAPLAAWIGPALILRYARDHKVGRGYVLVLAAYILAFSIGFGSFFGLPMSTVLALGNGLLMSLPYLADRLLYARIRGFAATLVFPLASTTLEILYIYFNPMGSWGATGFTQYGNLPLMQLASVTGMIGITFLMAWFAAVANWAWENRSRGREALRGMAVFGAVLAVVLLFGFLRLNLTHTRETDATVRVAGITAQGLNTLTEQLRAMPELDMRSPAVHLAIQSHQDAYFEATIREAQAGAKVIVWPEVSAMTLTADEDTLVARAQGVARQYGIYLALPLVVTDPDTKMWTHNKLLLIDPVGSVAMEHIKYGGAIVETTLVGDGILQTVDTPFGVLSGVICYDLDYPAVVRQIGQKGAGLLLVPSKDWFEIDPVHSYMAVFRAIENGTSIVRQTDTGLSIAADAYGRVLAQADFFGATDRTMVVQVPVRHVTTIYSLFGRWFEWLCVAGFAFVVAWGLRGRRRAEQNVATTGTASYLPSA